jgi:hypothetical protein
MKRIAIETFSAQKTGRLKIFSRERIAIEKMKLITDGG